MAENTTAGTAEERFVALTSNFSKKLDEVTAQVTRGTMSFDQAIAAVEELFVHLPMALHRLAESVKAGTLPP